MKIIKDGKNIINAEVKKKCGYCTAVFTYTKSDIQPDWRDGDYVICPCCKKFLSTT